MKAELLDLPKKNLWDNIVASSSGHIFQTSHWAEVAEAMGSKAIPMMIDGRAVLMAYEQPFFSAKTLRFVYNSLTILRGPVFRNNLFDRNLFLEFLRNVDVCAKQDKVAVCYFFPNIPFADRSAHQDLVTAGFKPVFDSSSFHSQTFVVSCDRPLEEIFRGMEKRTRWSINKAERSNISVEERSDLLGVNMFYGLYAETAPRPFAREFFEMVMRKLGAKGLARIFLAELGSSVASTAFLLTFGSGIFYVWGGSDPRYNKFCPGELLHWRIIQWGKEHGYRFYDLHGAVVEDSDFYKVDKKTINVTLFKRGFGGTYVRYLGEYRKVYSRLTYDIVSTIRRFGFT